MFETLLTKISIAVIVLIILVMVNGRRILQYKIRLSLFFLLYFADNFFIILANQFPDLQIIPNHIWEGFLVCSWSGKLYSILFTLALLFLSRSLLTWDEAGLTLRQKTGSLLPSAVVVLALAGWATWIGITSPDGKFDPITLLYLALMPALNEELVYRGFLLGILNKIMPVKFNFFGARIGWGAIISSIMFSLLHGFWFNNDLSIHIEEIALVNSLSTGLIFAWLRERTGSLFMPMIAHGAVDFLFFLPRMV